MTETVPRPVARLSALLVLLALATTGLAGCGDDAADGTNGLESVSVEGKVGADPTVTWDGRMDVEEIQSAVLVEGAGDPVENGDQVLAQLWIGNGYTNQVALDTHTAGGAESLTVGDQLPAGLREAIEGHPLGSRVAVAAPPEDAFGENGNPQLGLGNRDSVLFVVDLLDQVRDRVDGTTRKPPGWLPPLRTDGDGTPTGWDFAGAARPDRRLHVVPLVVGDGPRIGKDATIVARYLGQVFGKRKPFDDSYSSAEPSTFTLGSLVRGWQRGLPGIPAGSRVVLVVPPDLGYGEQGNPDIGVTGTDTLYFLIDVLATT